MFSCSKRKAEASAEQEYENKRANARSEEFRESFSLLLELVNQEPTLTHAFRIIQSQVLQGQLRLQVNGTLASPAFMRFAQEHYIPFCKESIKAMYTYGFVPWHFRLLRSGDSVPAVLPAGTFTWSIIHNDGVNMDCDYGDDATKTLLYDIKLLNAGNDLCREDVFIFETTPPTWNISQGSRIRSSYPSPLSHIIADYKNLRTAMNNKAHADAWNSQAHIITKQASNKGKNSPGKKLLEAGYQAQANQGNPQRYTYDGAQLQLHSRDQDIQEMFNKKATEHMPYVYTLPMDAELEPTMTLTPCSDIPFLDARLKNDISFLTGVPTELLLARGIANESNARTRTSTHQFHTAMDNIAQTLQRLLRQVYIRAYHGEHEVKRGKTETSHNGGAKTETSHNGGASGHTKSHTYTIPKGTLTVNTTDKLAVDSNPISSKHGNTQKPPAVQWYLEVAPILELDSVEDLVKLASIEGALNTFELRRIVQMLLYGKGTPAGSASNLCTQPTVKSTAVDGELPKEALIVPTPKPEQKSK
jgi:hypothetical protein